MRVMSFSNSSVTNTYRPDRRILDSIAALTQRVETLEAEKTYIQAENAELRAGLELLHEWSKTLTISETLGAPG